VTGWLIVAQSVWCGFMCGGYVWSGTIPPRLLWMLELLSYHPRHHITPGYHITPGITSPRGSVAALLLLGEDSHISDLEGQRLVSVTQLTYH
jgi:hypothetical protein